MNTPRRRCRSCGRWAKHAGGPCRFCGAQPEAIPAFDANPDEPTQRCTKCHLEYPESSYRFVPSRNPANPPHRVRWCRSCMSQYARDRRLFKSKEHHGISPSWATSPGSRRLAPTLKLRIWHLLDAAAVARTCGLWHGRKGLQAYRQLCEALDEWGAPAVDEATLAGDSTVELGQDHPPSHANPADTDWQASRHATPERLRGRLV